MAEDEINKNQEDTSNSNIPVSPINDVDSNIESNTPTTQEKKESDNQKEKECYKAIQVETIENYKWTRVEKITLLGVVVNGLMFLGTVVAIIITINANTSADKNFNKTLEATKKLVQANSVLANATKGLLNNSNINTRISDSALNSQIKAINYFKQTADASIKSASISDSGFKLTKTFALKSDSNYLKSIKIASNSIDISLQNLKLYKNNFEAENKPYIYFSEVKLDTIKINSPIIIVISFQNFGKAPSFLETITQSFDIKDTEPKWFKDFRYFENNSEDVNVFFPQNRILIKKYVSSFIVTPKMLNEIMMGKKFIYFHGLIDYFDLIRKSQSRYLFSFRINIDGTFSIYPALHNDFQESRDSLDIYK